MSSGLSGYCECDVDVNGGYAISAFLTGRSKSGGGMPLELSFVCVDIAVLGSRTRSKLESQGGLQVIVKLRGRSSHSTFYSKPLRLSAGLTKEEPPTCTNADKPSGFLIRACYKN